MNLSIQSNIDEIARKFSSISKTELDKATYLAINRAIDGAKTETDRAIRARYNIRQPDVQKVLSIKGYASAWKLNATLAAKGNRIPIYAFNPKPAEPVWRKPVSVSIRKGGGRKTSSTWFVARMKSGHVGIFRRKDPHVRPSKRLPIKEVFTISVPEMLQAREVMELVKTNTVARFDKEFERLISVILKGGLR